MNRFGCCSSEENRRQTERLVDLQAWVFFRDGAEQLEGTLASGILFGLRPEWPAEGIRVAVALMWAASSGWFLVGLFDPTARM